MSDQGSFRGLIARRKAKTMTIELTEKFIGLVDVMGFKSLMARADAGNGMTCSELFDILKLLGSEKDRAERIKHGSKICRSMGEAEAGHRERSAYGSWGFSWMLHANREKLVALATALGEIQLLDANGGKVGQLLGHKLALTSGLFSANDRYMLTLDAQNEMRLWQVPERRQIALLRGDDPIEGLPVEQDRARHGPQTARSEKLASSRWPQPAAKKLVFGMTFNDGIEVIAKPTDRQPTTAAA
jgi:hypothetical protein